jgi:gliding motility-associated-like protein
MKNIKNIASLSLMLCSFIAFAQDISLLNQFNGRFDFTMIGNTLNPVENESAVNCSIYTSSSASLNLDANDIIEKAYLYWAGSGTGDVTVKLNNQTIVAERSFSNAYFTYPFFSCFADVTSIIQIQGNGNYTLSDLDLSDIISNYCNNGINFGGWAIVVVFKNANLPLNQLNLYDGLESVSIQNPELNITIDNLNVIDNIGAKIGFLAWEGDAALAVNETLQINGNLVSNPPLNPATNVFNGTNSFTNATDLYNMDLDFYIIEDYIEIGDTQANIKLTSGQDFVMVNSIITKLNSQLPDATLTINQVVQQNCLEQNLMVDFTVFNQNGTGILPSNTPISLYINDDYFTTFYTNQELEVGESLNFNEIISVTFNPSEILNIRLQVDDDGMGNSTVIELNENNNFDSLDNQLLAPCNLVIPQVIIANSTDNNTFFIDGLQELYLDYELFIYNRYGSLIFKGDNKHPLWNGTYKGKSLPSATYFYALYLHDEQNITYDGWVYFLR